MSGGRLTSTVVASVVAIAAGLLVLAFNLFTGVEQDSRGARFDLRHTAKPTDIVVVGIDEGTFAALDVRWPFKRSLHARAIDALHDAGAREIVYDVQFTEPTKPTEDQALYDSIGRAGGAVLATAQSDGRGHTRVLGGDASLRQIHSKAGAANLEPGSGGLLSRYPYEVDGLKSLAVVAAERALARPVDRSPFGKRGAWIDYRGGIGTFRTIPFSDVVNRKFDRKDVAGKIVIVGATAPTLQDVHATPTSGSDFMSGPEIQANALWTALHGGLKSVPWPIDALFVVLLGAALPLIRLRFRILIAAIFVPLIALGFLLLAQALFNAGWILTVTAPLVALIVGAFLTLVVSHILETRERERVARQKALLEEMVSERTEQLRETQLEVIWRLSQAAESRDEDTGLHIERISALCQTLALELGMPPDEAELIGHAAALHDVGKIAVPDSVLLKPGKLDEHEYEVMKTHTSIGANVLADSASPLLQTAEAIARSHHERWDGTGYPAGLKGAETPLAARICSVCDVFDALMSKRVYKEAWGMDDAIAELERSAGTQFDPAVVQAFVRIAPEAYEELLRVQTMRRLEHHASGHSRLIPLLGHRTPVHAEPQPKETDKAIV